MVFTVGGSFSEAQNTLAGQAQKAIFQLNKYLYKFTILSPRHKLDLFDKLILPILNYGSEVWGFSPVGLDSEKRIFSEKMRKERKKRGKRGEKIGKRGKFDVTVVWTH